MLNKAEFKGGDVLPKDYLDLIADELNVKEVVWEGKGGNLSLNLDTVITPELQIEGYKREMIRTVNALRKEAGLTPAHRIEIWVEGDEAAVSWLPNVSEDLKKSTLADNLEVGATDKSVAEKGVKFESGPLTVRIVRV